MMIAMMKIVNIVCEYHLLGEIDTSELTRTKNFSGFTLKKGSKACRVFNKGYCIVTGTRDVEEADLFIRENFPLHPIITRKILLITASQKIPFKFSFSSLLSWHKCNPDRSNFRYEGELFPAIYWIREPETVYFFSSQSAIITGVKSIDRVENVWREFLRELWEICMTLELSNSN